MIKHRFLSLKDKIVGPFNLPSNIAFLRSNGITSNKNFGLSLLISFAEVNCMRFISSRKVLRIISLKNTEGKNNPLGEPILSKWSKT